MNFGGYYFSSTQEETSEMSGDQAAGHGEHDKSSDVIFFIFSSLCLGGIVKEINKKTSVFIFFLFLVNFFVFADF